MDNLKASLKGEEESRMRIEKREQKKAFSLVELLIVLMVIAALIATVTPIAMGASRKAKAIEIASNIKMLADTLEKLALTNGVDSEGKINGVSVLADIARDVKTSSYRIVYYNSDPIRTYKAYVVYKDNVLFESINKVLANSVTTSWSELKEEFDEYAPVYYLDEDTFAEGELICYPFSFYIYE